MKLSNKAMIIKYKFIILALQLEIAELANRKSYSITEMETNALNDRIELINLSIKDYEEKIERLKTVAVEEAEEETIEEDNIE